MRNCGGLIMRCLILDSFLSEGGSHWRVFSREVT